MEIQIQYKDIIDRCEQLSSFEARGKVDATGQSRYLDIHIGEVDQLLINQYIEQARAILEEKFDRMITDSVVDDVIYSFYEIIEGSDFSQFEGKISDDKIDIKGMDTKVYFLRGNRYMCFGRYIESSHSPYYRYILTNHSVVGSDYVGDNGKVKVYIDRLGNKYTRTDGDLILATGSTDAFTWTLRTDTRWNGINTFAKHVTEAITSYVMAQWLSGRLDERVQFYETLFTSSLSMATKNLFTKQAP